MSKILKVALIIVLTAVITIGCKNEPAPVPDNGKPLVYASFYPMYDFVVKAAGDLADVRCLVPDGVEPHDWEPSPQDIIGLERADLFIYSGGGFEAWVDSVVPGLKNDKLVVLMASPDMGSVRADPHTWLLPELARQQFTQISAALETVDPGNQDKYAANREHWIREFGKLDEEYSVLKQAPRKQFIVTHAAFGNLCSAYGLEQIAISGFSPDDEPGPARMAEIITIARKNDIKYVFYEELSNTKLARAVADEIGAEILPLNPIEGLTAKEREDGEDYFSVMRKNLAALKGALS